MKNNVLETRKCDFTLSHFQETRILTSSTVFPGNSEQSFVYIQRGQSVTLFPMIEASKLIPLQSLLSLLEHMRRGAALKRLVQNHRDALANLR